MVCTYGKNLAYYKNAPVFCFQIGLKVDIPIQRHISLQVSQSRLEARTHRPDVELCRDPVHHRLVEEVGQIQESVDLLNRKLNEAEQAHQDLLVNKAR